MLNPQQFEGSQNGYNQPVLDPKRFEPLNPRMRPPAEAPPGVRPPNVFRTKAGDNGLRRGPNVNAMRPRSDKPLILGGVEYPIVDPGARSDKWPVIAPGPRVGLN